MTHSGQALGDAEQHGCASFETREVADLLSLLHREVREGLGAASRLDLSALELHTRLAADLCRQLQCIQITPSEVRVGIHELQASAAALADMCGAYRCLLQKSRRTINILMNVLATASVAYSPRMMRSSLLRDSRL